MGQPREKTRLTVELMKRGATMLKEPCPTCNGVQIRFKGKTYCTSHDNLEVALSSKELTYGEIAGNLNDVILMKLREKTAYLVSEKDTRKEEETVSLLLKYVDLLKKISEGPQRA